jgi:hypothetical protein
MGSTTLRVGRAPHGSQSSPAAWAGSPRLGQRSLLPRQRRRRQPANTTAPVDEVRLGQVKEQHDGGRS